MNTAQPYNNPEDYKEGETILADAEVVYDDKSADPHEQVMQFNSTAKKKEKESHGTDSISYRITVATNKLLQLEKSKKEITQAISQQMKRIKTLRKIEKQLEDIGK